MARHRTRTRTRGGGRGRSRAPSLSLFPFLSVLACVIGVLTLMIAALAIGQLVTDTVDVAAFEAAQLDVASSAAERTELVRRLELVRALELADRSRALERERERLRAEIAQASVELDRDDPPTEPRILLQPSGSGRRLSPRFVECGADAVRLREPGGWSGPIGVSQLSSSARFRRFLRGAGATSGGTVIFLIRPDGVASYNSASAVATRLGVHHGKLPLPGQGQIDFSLL